ncbi:MAG: aromatic ring-hydroxylating dioxygenase subunit alpha [Acidobacteria bacterium]|nr:aromatic ring-hydroxylating dioxygenase subunit alpha [Acidobacteriota bacterium]
MIRNPLSIEPDIARAATLPGTFYRDPALWEAARERVFARAWQLVGHASEVKTPGQVKPVTLLPGLLDEPIVLVRDEEDCLHALSNVCTHRGALVCEGETLAKNLRCRYHGRRFGLDGRFLSMPEFDGAQDFPRPEDSLPKLPLEEWRGFLFTCIGRPAMPFAEWAGELETRAGFLPVDSAVFDASRSRDYAVGAHWALYCDNYLEGFHIPYVHPALTSALDYGAYRTELQAYSSTQVGVAIPGEDAFEPPAGHPDHGARIGGFYVFLFPNTMFNVYPWGISVNVVKPVAPGRTKVSFLSYVWDAARLDVGAGAALDRVEREDEAVVESVFKGVSSRLYTRGRFSPRREEGVHHFHRLLAEALG